MMITIFLARLKAALAYHAWCCGIAAILPVDRTIRRSSYIEPAMHPPYTIWRRIWKVLNVLHFHTVPSTYAAHHGIEQVSKVVDYSPLAIHNELLLGEVIRVYALRHSLGREHWSHAEAISRSHKPGTVCCIFTLWQNACNWIVGLHSMHLATETPVQSQR